MNLSTITNTALSVAGQAANLGLKVGQEVFTRVNGLRGGNDEEATFTPTSTPAKPAATAKPSTPKRTTPEPAAAKQPATKSQATGAPRATTKPLEPKADAKPSTARAGRFVREVSDPKKARKLREREGAATAKSAATSSTSAGKVEGATGHGGTPATVEAENTPKKLASAGKGREAAPLGATDDTPQS